MSVESQIEIESRGRADLLATLTRLRRVNHASAHLDEYEAAQQHVGYHHASPGPQHPVRLGEGSVVAGLDRNQWS